MTAGSVDEFEAQRPRLFGLAYRLLGSAEEAEDAVQDAFLRWNGADRAAIETPSAWLAKVVTNLCLNRLTSARARREQYIGQWLPEPVVTEGGALGPLETTEQRESVSLALLVLLERLTPTERAVFVLREAFGYSHREVAELVELTEPHCRQLHRRARERVTADAARPVRTPDREQWRRFVERFLTAARDGDLPGLERLLAADAISWADGGGRVGVARRPILGATKIARYLAGGWAKFARDVEFTLAEVNGGPGVLAWLDGALGAVLAFDIADERVTGLRIIANPDKLAIVERQTLDQEVASRER
ncbi:RNA polymerase sigma-70 factor [Amycolatopsis anabasis]|uniref:RNA polymerase sigma-70 factor n=1 Tax=Amycolatopsis anabasis TaxID=1840409 RepID=UPI00131DCAAE|nr:RNA polymerase sigma-70 factor [Amycolatopsis anabasis]